MPSLNLLFLGPPQIEIEGEPTKINRRKAVALLAYLAVTRHSHDRDALAALFWPEAARDRARAGVRQTLWELNKTLGGGWLETDGDRVALPTRADIWVDVHAFHALLATSQNHAHPVDQTCADCLPLLTDAVNLYRDDFLAGFNLSDSPAFDEWQYLEAENLRRELAAVLEKLGDYFIAAGDFETAIPYLRRWSALDPLSDTPHYRLLQVYAWTDQRAAAVRHYQQYAELLKQELGLGPRDDIATLYRHIRREEGQQKKVNPALAYKITALVDEADTATTPAGRSSGEGDEIRLTTVLIAGLSQTDSLAWQVRPEQIADATQTLLQIVSQVINRYHGQVVHFAGSSVQAIFGMVQAYEDDPERAIHAALEIQQLARQEEMALTVGISTGHIYLGLVGNSKFQNIAALGPVVNLAARLQNEATAGQIIVSQDTYRHTQHIFDFVPLSMTIRGMVEPLEAYGVERAVARPRKMRGLKGLRASLIGRDEALQKLKAALSAVRAGQGHFVSLMGEAGLGKSRLIEALKQVVETAAPGDTAPLWPPLWLESRCLALRTATGFWPFIDLLQRYLQTIRGAATEIERTHALAAYLEMLRRQGRFGGDVRRAEEINTLLSNLLSLEVAPEWAEWLDGLDAQSLQHQTFLALSDFFTALAVEQPLLLIFEDFHWADDLSFDLMSLLMETLRSNPILMICVYRPHYQHKDLRLSALAARKCPERYTELTLRELSPDQSRRLLESLLDLEELPPAFEALVLKRTQGNPLFMEEVIRDLIENGVLYAKDGQAAGRRWHIQAEIDPALTVPQSVQSVILSRVDRLESPLKQLLRSAAVVGHNFQTQIVARMTPDVADVGQALWRLEEAALIYRERVVPEEAYIFKHVLIQDTVYQTIPPDQRAALHQRVAEIIEQQYRENLTERYEQLAYHYQRSRLAGKAIQYLCQAGEKSRRIFLNEAALRYFDQALQFLREFTAGQFQAPILSDWQLMALTGLGRTYHRLGQATQAETYLRQAVALAEETEAETSTLIRLYHWLGEVLFWQEKHIERGELGHKGLALLTAEAAESVEAALMNQLIAMSRIKLGDIDQFQRWTEKTARFIRELPYLEELRPAYFHIGISLYFQKRRAETAAWLQTVGAWASQHNDQGTLAELYDLEFSFDFGQGDLQTARAKAEQVIALYRQGGHERRIWYSLQDIIGVCLHLGDFSAAARYAQQALELAEAMGLDKYRSVSLLMVGVVRLGQRAWPQATAALQQVIHAPSDIYRWTEWTARYCLGQIDHFQGRPQAARDHFQTAMTLFDADDLSPVAWFSRWPFLACLLTGLEESYEATTGDGQAFRAFCQTFEPIRERPTLVPIPKQWRLEPLPAGQPHLTPDSATFHDPFESNLAPDWTWHDPLADCAFQVEAGLEMQAANGRDLRQFNLSAPRLLRPVANDFVAQTICRPVATGSQQPAIGGLLLWKDDFNFLRLLWGSRGEREVAFDGCLDNRYTMVGRGLLPQSTSPHIFLRLIQQKNKVRALCSRDGDQWFSLGQIRFPVAAPLEIGLHAVGWIDRLIYPNPYPDGTALRFESFSLWI